MSDNEDPTGDEYITPELQSGHLHIVELSPIEIGEGVEGEGYELREVAELEGEIGGEEEGIEMEGGKITGGDKESIVKGEAEEFEGEIGDEDCLEMDEGEDMGEEGDGEGGEASVGVEMYEIGEEEAEEAESDMKYMQVLDPSGKELMQFDLMNFTLVRCGDDNEEKYKLVANSELQQMSDGADVQDLDPDNATVTYVVSTEGDEDQEADMSNAYVVLEGEQHEQEQDSYVMVESQDGPIVFLQSELKPVNKKSKTSTVEPEKTEIKKIPTTLELFEKAKVVNRAKKLLKAFEKPQTGPRGRGRPRKFDFPEANELLSSPSFRLFLYSCKLCDFKCNATKELTTHKEKEHGNWAVKYRTQYRVGTNSILTSRKEQRQAQCPHCPYRGISRDELDQHIDKNHNKKTISVEIQIEQPAEVKKKLEESSSKQNVQTTLRQAKKRTKSDSDDDDNNMQNVFLLENSDAIYVCNKKSTT